MTYDCIIIGAGPAGCTAAIQLKRMGLDVLLVEKNEVGGLARNAWKMENLAGFEGGISGLEFAENLKKQIKSFKIEVKKAEINKVSRKKEHFIISLNDEMFFSRFLIVATGTESKKLDVGREAFYGVHELVTNIKNGSILVIGGSDAAIDQSLTLMDKGFDVEVMTKGKVRCNPVLMRHKIKRHLKCVEDALLDDIKLRAKEASAVLVAIGREPCIPKLPEDMKNIFVIGDARGKKERQVHIATGNAMEVAHVILSEAQRAKSKDIARRASTRPASRACSA